tara:strand:+ start:640 stop:789 length:150 start_codon:yes stop_codon:yes gene_type:complete
MNLSGSFIARLLDSLLLINIINSTGRKINEDSDYGHNRKGWQSVLASIP